MGAIHPIKWILGRTLILVLGFVILANITVDFARMRLKVLNETQPDFKELVNFMKNPAQGNIQQVKPYARYYKLTARYLPKGPMSQAMAGYTQYYLGNKNAALRLMREAASMKPKCFWLYYNVGIMYFNKSNYPQAVKYFQTALSMPIDDTIDAMLAFKIYHDILAVAVKQGIDPTVSLQAGYAKAQQILAQAWVGNPDQLTYELQIF